MDYSMLHFEHIKIVFNNYHYGYHEILWKQECALCSDNIGDGSGSATSLFKFI